MKNSSKRKRLLPIALAALTILVACLFGFVGCDNSNPGEDTDPTPEAPTYTISFVTGEGGSTVPAITDVAGATITPPADPTKANAVFDGWYATADFSGEKVTLPTTMPEGGATYYAKFTDTHTVSFVTGEGGSTVPAITDVAGATITPPANPTKTNAVFDGWYATADFSGDKVTLPTTMPQGGATYYAKFIDKLTVSFLVDGSVVKSVNDVPGAALEAPANPTKDHAVFDGWYAHEDLSGGKVTVPTLMPDAPTTYYGRFLNLYTLSYSGNAPAGVTVSGTMQSAEVTEGTPATVAANAFGATGYRFMGWSTTADGAVNVGATVELERNTTLYAVWQRGYQNQLDNGDYLFISGAEAVLVRGSAEYTGTYNATAKTFVVTVGAETVTGRLFENNTYSCFGEHSLGVYALYNAYTGEAVADGAVLKLFDNRIAEYNGERAAYEYVGDGNYSLTVGANVLVFKLGTVTVEEDEVLVYYVRGNEAGKYTLYGDKPTLKLDGYGNGEYDLYGYGNNHDDITYAPHADGDGSLAWNSNKVKVDGEYYALYNDALAGTYTSGSDTLVLDGYMGATLNDADGFYAAKTVAGVDGTFVTVAVGDVEQSYNLDGNTMSAVGNELGKYDRYENGSYASRSLVLDGNGNCKILNGNSEVADGTYTYVDETLAISLSTAYDGMTEIVAILRLHPTNGSTIVVFRNDTYAGTYSNGGDTLDLDGYGNATYTKAGVAPIENTYKYDGKKVTLGESSNSITLYVNTTAKTFATEALDIKTGSSDYYYYSTNSGNGSSGQSGDKRMQLKSNGTATITEWKYGKIQGTNMYYWFDSATGTYEEIGNGLLQFTPDAASSSVVSEFTFALESGSPLKCIIANQSLVVSYTCGTQTLSCNAFGKYTYTDAAGVSHNGTYTEIKSSGTVLCAVLEGSDGRFVFKVNQSAGTFVVVGSEGGEYSPIGGGYVLKLDGEGNAVYGITDGTYALVAGETDVYTFTYANPGTGDSQKLPFNFRLVDENYVVANAEREANYTNGGMSLVVDAYGYATYTDTNGVEHIGTYSVSNDEATLLCDGDTLKFKLYEGGSFAPIGAERGNYLYNTTRKLDLDGIHGAVITYNGISVAGTYSAVQDVDNTYTFASESLNFTFRISSSTQFEIAFDHADTYLGANDFNMLVLGSYGSAQYINETGAVEDGKYLSLSDHIVRYSSDAASTTYRYFRIDYDRNMFVEDKNEFVIDNGVLTAYSGEGGEIVVPDEVTAIAEGAFKGNGSVTVVDLNNVAVIGVNAFASCSSLTSVNGLIVTEIGEGAFKGSDRLDTAVFGNQLVKIADEAFYGVSSSLKAHDLAVVIHGTAIPQLGASVFSYNDYNSSFRVDSLEVALSWFSDEVAAEYSGKITFGVDSTVSTYYNLANWAAGNEIVLSAGRAQSGNNRWLYVVDGNSVTLYAYSSTADNKYTVTEGTLESGLLILADKTYAVEGTEVTYTDSDENVLVVTLGKELSATYNGVEVTFSSSSKFDISVNGYGYTCTLSSYSATTATNGTFAATKAFKEVTYTLTELDGTSTATIKQTGINTWVSVSGSIVVDGSTNRLYGGRWEIAKKTDYGFMIIDLNYASKPYIYKLTLVGENQFTVVKENFTTVELTDSNSGAGAKVYLDEDKNVIHVVLMLKSSSSASSPSTYVQDYLSDYSVQADGSYLFSNITSPTWLSGKSYTVTVAQDSDGTVTGVTVTEVTA